MGNETSKSGINSVIVRCAAAVVCTAVVCGSVYKCTADYSNAVKETAAVSGSATQITDNSGVDTNLPTDDQTVPSDDSDVVAVDDTTLGSNQTDDNSATASTTKAPASSSNQQTQPAALTKAQIISMFNTAANSAKSSSKSIHQNYCKNTQTSTVELNNATLKKIANKLISSNMGEDKKKTNVTYTTSADKVANFPVSGQSWASKLTSSDVKDASISKANGVYTITIRLIDDTTPNIKKGAGHAGKAFSIVTKDQIVDGAGSLGMSVIKEDSIKITYKNCVIKATVDAATGRLKTVNYFQDWRLALTAMGIDVAICFGISEDYLINW